MQLPSELTTVTPLSKAVALIVFISLPIIAFLFGMNYQMMLLDAKQPVAPLSPAVACTEEARMCPDGSAVGRIGPNCEFEECPVAQVEGSTFTGVITRISYDCHMDGICSIGVGKASVIVEKGLGVQGESQVRGTFPEDLMDETKINFYVGKEVEVYAASPDGRTDSYTLFGNGEFYIKLVDEVSTLTCGGFAGKVCPSGYYCKYEGTYPDAAGTCLPDKVKSTYSCPTSEYVDCMPGPGAVKTNCSQEFLAWARINCPNFKGVAY